MLPKTPFPDLAPRPIRKFAEMEVRVAAAEARIQALLEELKKVDPESYALFVKEVMKDQDA